MSNILIKKSVGFWICAIAYISLIVWYIRLSQRNGFPTVIECEEQEREHRFCAKRAIEDVKFLSKDIGVRLVGSAGERKSIDFLVKELKQMKEELEQMNSSYRLEIEEQVISADLYFDIRKNIISYGNITNVLARIVPKSDKQELKYEKEGFLISSHFDSGAHSPGAFDDGVEVAVMLEVLRNILKELKEGSLTMKHPLYLIFNDAEELGLCGSHAFVEYHPWIENIKAFLNLEAGGTGGHAYVIQSSNAWVAKQFSKDSVYLRGNVVGQDIFRSGLFPSFTDYRIYEKKIQHGIDYAFFANGYYYHTKLDGFEKVVEHERSVQQMGDNVHYFTKHMISLDDKYSNVEDKKLVYFDFIGLFMISYDMGISAAINAIIITISIISIITIKTKHRISLWSLIKYFFHIVIYFIVAIMSSILVSYLLVNVFEKRMVFYSSESSFSLALYGFPTIFSILTCVYILHYRSKLEDLDREKYYLTVWIFWLVLLGIGTFFDIGSTFLPMIIGLNLLVSYIFTAGVHTILHLVCSSFFPLLVMVDMTFLLVDMLLPTMGRVPIKHTDYIVSGFISVLIFASFTLVLPFLFRSESPTIIVERSKKKEERKLNTKELSLKMFLIHLIVFLIIATLLFYQATNKDPYSKLRPKRMNLQHVMRYEINAVTNEGYMLENFLSLKSLDGNNESHILPHISKKIKEFAWNVDNQKFLWNETLGLTYRIPSLISVRQESSSAHVLKLQVKKHVQHVPNIQITRLRELDEEGMKAFRLEVTSPSDIFTQQLQLLTGSEIGKWSLKSFPPQTYGKKFFEDHYLYDWFSVYGSRHISEDGNKSYHMIFYLTERQDVSKEEIVVHVISHMVDPDTHSEELRDATASFPEFVTLTEATIIPAFKKFNVEL